MTIDSGTPVTDDRAPADDIRYRRRLLAVVMLAVMTFGSLMTIVTVSLDLIADDLDSSRATLTWMITGLMLAVAVASPIAGKVGDMRGHRRMFLIGLTGGLITTLLSAVAWDPVSLIVFRVLFGLTGAMMMPSSIALMMQAYPAEQRATAMGWYQFAMTGAPTIGLVAGGPLIDIVGWRAIFVGFAGVTLTALVSGYRVVRPTPRLADQQLDYPGALTLGGAVLAGLLALTRLADKVRTTSLGAAATDATVLWLTGLCVVLAIAFINVELRSPAPMLRLGYFRRRNFTLPMVSSALVQFAYMGGFVVTPALLDRLYGLSLGAIALILVPRPGVFSLASPVGGYLATRIGEKKPIVAGGILMIGSMVAFAAAALVDLDGGRTLGLGLVVLGLSLSGAASGISQPSVTSMVVGSVDEADIGIANGMIQQLMFIGIVSGIQTMNVLVGDSTEPRQFAITFSVGLGVAALGLMTAVGAGSCDRGDRAATVGPALSCVDPRTDRPFEPGVDQETRVSQGSASPLKVGFIGLGNVGGKLAGSLLRNGIDLTVRDLDRDAAAQPFLDREVRAWADSPKEMAEAVDMVITCLPSPAASAAVMEADGRRPGRSASRGKIWAEMSTTDEAEVKRLGALVEAKGRAADRLPGVRRLSSRRHRQHRHLRRLRATGTFERAVADAHDGLGRRILHTGPLGSASVLKVVTNYLATANLVTLVRGIGRRCARWRGMDLNTTYEAIRISSGTPSSTRPRVAGHPQRQPGHQLHHGSGGQGS